MGVASIVVGAAILLVIAWYCFAGLAWFFTELIPQAYRTLKYERKGICPKCKQPFAAWVSRSADQTYGPDQIVQGICKCGERSLPMGNRRFADWADY